MLVWMPLSLLCTTSRAFQNTAVTFKGDLGWKECHLYWKGSPPALFLIEYLPFLSIGYIAFRLYMSHNLYRCHAIDVVAMAL